MSDWNVGDLALCVDAQEGRHTGAKWRPAHGVTYRISGVWKYLPSDLADCDLGLHLDEDPSGDEWAWPEYMFRKIRPDEHTGEKQDWIDLLKVVRAPKVETLPRVEPSPKVRV